MHNVDSGDIAGIVVEKIDPVAERDISHPVDSPRFRKGVDRNGDGVEQSVMIMPEHHAEGLKGGYRLLVVEHDVGADNL